jgi:hypothetical protein
MAAAEAAAAMAAAEAAAVTLSRAVAVMFSNNNRLHNVELRLNDR